MKTIEITIKGVSPLLMHKFPLVQIEALEKKPPAEQAELAAYRDAGGNLCIPGACVQRALVSAATFSKGRGRASLQKEVAACLLIEEAEIGLGTKSFEIDSRPVVVNRGGRIIRHRPRLNEWACSFTATYDERLITEKQIHDIVSNCGSRVGLLDFRPECKGPFGRFIITAFNPSKE